MNFDKTSPRKRNSQQQKISRNATKKQANCAGKPPNWQHWARSCIPQVEAR